jgi:hypothetical protein
MCHIIQSIPWSCGERSCPVGWHLANYWINEDGYSVDRYGDGDHEDIEHDDVPAHAEYVQAWGSYYEHIAKTLQDPLFDLQVKTKVATNCLWRLQLQKSIGGVVICLASRNRRRVSLSTLPQEVLDYMHATCGPMNRVVTSLSWDELVACPEVTPSKRFPSICAVAEFRLSISRPRSAKSVQRDLKVEALRRLKMIGATSPTLDPAED